jgi:hypothetical protein
MRSELLGTLLFQMRSNGEKELMKHTKGKSDKFILYENFKR